MHVSESVRGSLRAGGGGRLSEFAHVSLKVRAFATVVQEGLFAPTSRIC